MESLGIFSDCGVANQGAKLRHKYYLARSLVCCKYFDSVAGVLILLHLRCTSIVGVLSADIGCASVDSCHTKRSR